MKILVCDDHAVVRDGLRLALGGLGPDVELADAEGLEAGLALARGHGDLDLVLLDLQMPGVEGLDGLRRFRAEHPSLPVVVVSGREDAAVMREALDLGASGFIPKSTGSDALRAAVRLVLEGGVYVPQGALVQSPDDARARARRERAAGLTQRQQEVLSLLARGLTNREICGVLGIAENTVKTHVKAILDALDASNRTEAAVLARELDLRAPGEAT